MFGDVSAICDSAITLLSHNMVIIHVKRHFGTPAPNTHARDSAVAGTRRVLLGVAEDVAEAFDVAGVGEEQVRSSCGVGLRWRRVDEGLKNSFLKRLDSLIVQGQPGFGVALIH